MYASALPNEVLFFHCEACGTELSVPIALQGIEGPCPCCGRSIKAPEYAMPVRPPAVYLPPLDRQHEPASVLTESIPVPVWMHEPGDGVLKVDPLPDVSEEVLGETTRAKDRLPGLVPRWMAGKESLGFQARLAIPAAGENNDEPGRDALEGVAVRKLGPAKLEDLPSRPIESPGFRIARMAVLIATGGMGAGLVLYLQERNWVLDLPWQPAPVESVVEVPVAGPVRAPLPVDRVNPFVAEDPSDLETLSSAPALAPLQPLLPGPVSVPVGGTPIAAGKK